MSTAVICRRVRAGCSAPSHGGAEQLFDNEPTARGDGADGVGTLLPDASSGLSARMGGRVTSAKPAPFWRSVGWSGPNLWDSRSPPSVSRTAGSHRRCRLHAGTGRLVVTAGRTTSSIWAGQDRALRHRGAHPRRHGRRCVLIAIENEAGVGQLHVCIERRDPPQCLSCAVRSRQS